MNNREKLVDAFNRLVVRNYIDRINVQMITREAGVSRTVFYRYFKDKYDLMNYVYQAEIEEKIRTSGDRGWKRMTQYCYEFIYERKDFFTEIVKYKNQNSFLEFLNEYSIRKTAEAMCAKRQIAKLSPSVQLSLELYCSGCTHIVGRWIEGGLKESPEVMCRMVCASVPRNLTMYFEGLTLL